MKAGRNEPCPCGSGKKYKKCCMAKAQSEPAASASSSLGSGSRATDSVLATSRQAGPLPGRADAAEPRKPPSPPDPVAERAESRWRDFEAQFDEGRIAVFLETLEDAEVMTDDLAFEMLMRLYSDANTRGDRLRILELVFALRERRPEAYEKSAHYYLSWSVVATLAENRPEEEVAALTRELAALAGGDIDVFHRAADALAYHGKLSVLVRRPIGLPGQA